MPWHDCCCAQRHARIAIAACKRLSQLHLLCQAGTASIKVQHQLIVAVRSLAASCDNSKCDRMLVDHLLASARARSVMCAAQQAPKRSGRMINVSKSMSRILRHDPPASIDGGGWVPLHDLLLKIGGRASVEDIKQVVESDEKGRFQVTAT